MCAPASVTALHQVLTVSTLHAYFVSQVVGALGVLSTICIALIKALKGC